MSDPIDDVLDDLFTRLAPLGPAGRRAYLEAEAHLLQAVAEDEARGASSDAAYSAALSRFGEVSEYVEGVDAVSRLGFRALVIRLVGDAWLLGALAGFFVGLAGVALAVVRAVSGVVLVASDLSGTVLSKARCAQLAEYYPHAATCLQASRLHHADEIVGSYQTLGLVGVGGLVAYWLARRGRGGPLNRFAAAAQPDLVAVVGVVGAGTLALLQFLQGTADLAVGARNGLATTLAVGAAAALAAVALSPRALAALRAPRPAGTVER